MSTSTSAAPHPLATLTIHHHRIVSLDILRGLNIAIMIFVNELAGVKGLPWWTYHAPGTIDVMTYVDMVFPGFLFILGMAIPLALQARTKKGDNIPALLGHIALRSVALLVLGIILANGSRGNPDLMHGIGRFAWGFTALLSACLIWFVYPKTEDRFRCNLYRGLRLLGFGILVALAVIYRGNNRDGSIAWFSYGYPEILGLIGYTYFAVSLLYLATRRWLWAPAVWFVGFTAFNIACSGHYIDIHLPWYQFPLQNGSMPSIAFAGITLTTIFFLEPRFDTFARRPFPQSFWPFFHSSPRVCSIPSASRRFAPPRRGVSIRSAPRRFFLYCSTLSATSNAAPSGLTGFGPQGRTHSSPIYYRTSGTTSSASQASLTLTRTSIGALGESSARLSSPRSCSQFPRCSQG